MKKDSNQGYLTLEAALIISLLIVSVLVFAFLIHVASTEENIMHTMADEARLSIVRGYFVSKDWELPLRVEKRILKDKLVSYTRVGSYWFMHSDGFNDGLISFNNKTICRIKLPIFNVKEVKLKNRLMCRAFIGSRPISGPMSFDLMEEEGRGDQVWIFPISGLRYHHEACRYLNPKPTETLVGSAVKKGFKPCRLCKAKQMQVSDGCYYFEKYGSVYHRSGCNSLVKRAIALDREDAIERGYTACSKCGD